MTPEPLLRFGLLADVQYGDKEPHANGDYRASLAKLERCVADLSGRGLDFVAQLGDAIDGRETEELSRADLEQVAARLERLDAPLEHVIGNHCLAVPRPALLERLRLERAHRSLRRAGWRFVVLDSMAVSLMGVPAESAAARRARAWLADHPLETHPQATEWNGALGEEQLEWLAEELVDAARGGERAVVLCHHPIDPDAAEPHFVVWDHADALQVLERAPAPVAWINGHYHKGGTSCRAGVEHWSVPAMLLAPPERDAWNVVTAFEDRLEARGASGKILLVAPR